MHAHLTHLSEPSVTLQGLTEQAAFFLLSICIRSAEGRKRIVNEIVHTLSPSDKAETKSDEQGAVRRPASNPYKVQPGFPAPHKVRTHIPPVPTLEGLLPLLLAFGACLTKGHSKQHFSLSGGFEHHIVQAYHSCHQWDTNSAYTNTCVKSNFSCTLNKQRQHTGLA